MNKAQKKAHELLRSVGWSEPGDLTVEEMVWASGAFIKEMPIGGSEGRILVSDQNAIITLDSEIDYIPKKNYVLAHELAHFHLHKHLSVLFSDTDSTLSEWRSKGDHEKEANDFASELLMPSHLFSQKVKGKRLDLSLIEETANYFGTSLTATFLKYRILGDFPVMIIFSEDNIIKWKQSSHDFPFQWIPKHAAVPVYTVAGDFFNGSGLEDEPVKVDAIEWFPEDWEIEKKKNWKLWEQCFQVSANGVISCLWTY